MNDPILHIRSLRKKYRRGASALKGIDLDIPAGIFGLLGPRGSGKTTLIKILATLLDPDEGAAWMGDVDLIEEKAEARRMLGYVPQTYGFYPHFTAAEMLDYFAKLKGLGNAAERRERVNSLLEMAGLLAESGLRLGGFSGGMLQRLAIAQALIAQPKLLLVDELTEGFDPEERRLLHNLLGEVASDVVVLLSTRLVSDVSTLCERVAIIYDGRILVERSRSEAVSSMVGSVWEATVARATAEALKPRIELISSHMVEGRARIRAFADDGPPGEQFAPATPTLGDFYFSVVNRAAREDGYA